MPWLKVGDDAATHPIRMRVFGLGPVVDLQQLDAWARANLVFGFVVSCATVSAGHLTDRFVSAGTVMSIGGPDWERWAKDATRAGYWKRTRVDGEPGYEIVDLEEFLHIRMRAAVEFDRKRDADRRNPALTMAVRRRDGDSCRYCGFVVNWHDRKGARGGTYDHLDPTAETTVDTYVVCCRGCNAGRQQHPDAYTLRPVPDVPYYHPKTLEQLADHGLLPRPGTQPDTAPATQQPAGHRSPTQRPGTQPDTAPATQQPAGHRSPTQRPGTQPDHDGPLADPPDRQTGGPGFAGTGRDRDRSDRGGTGARASPRNRGQRGRRR